MKPLPVAATVTATGSLHHASILLSDTGGSAGGRKWWQGLWKWLEGVLVVEEEDGIRGIISDFQKFKIAMKVGIH
ncbi:hypothetical protein CRG98_009428 [Punica granatum]|uniref:Uncharacterized protein n=1 Tax=Punica granatum TaxID=22663 RepID=A0A2I0KNW4_PUNGR|nr:hypothetical protein CRG98_009428 [Punica granatum]